MIRTLSLWSARSQGVHVRRSGNQNAGGPVERTLFLIMALMGYLIGTVLAVSDASTASAVAFGIASTLLLIWAIALGVHLGIKDAVSDLGSDAVRDEVTRRLRAGGSD